MKLMVFILLAGIGAQAVSPSGTGGQEQAPAKPAVAPAPEAAPQTQKVEEVAPTAPKAGAAEPGFMEPVQVKALLRKVWLASYRVNDLLTEVHPEKWKMSGSARASFQQTLETLRKQLQSLEDWRSQFEKRPDSMYLGFQTYIAINAVLPRLEGVANGITRFENASFGAQYHTAGDQLFDLQQSLQPYLSYMMRNQDELFYATQTNLASCQNELGFAMRPRVQPAIPMKNIMPELKGRHVRQHNAAAAAAAKSEKSEEKKAKAAAKSPAKAEAKTGAKPTKR